MAKQAEVWLNFTKHWLSAVIFLSWNRCTIMLRPHVNISLWTVVGALSVTVVTCLLTMQYYIRYEHYCPLSLNLFRNIMHLLISTLFIILIIELTDWIYMFVSPICIPVQISYYINIYIYIYIIYIRNKESKISHLNNTTGKVLSRCMHL